MSLTPAIADQIQHYEACLAEFIQNGLSHLEFRQQQNSGLLSVPRVESLSWPAFSSASVAVDVLRMDSLHPVISGNKWFKLKYNLVAAREQGCSELLSFGGAWSNHLHALAWLCQQLGWSSVGVVRGDEHEAVSNAMLQDVAQWGMQLRFVSRARFRELRDDQCALARAGRYIIPEGGDNWPGLLGVAALAANRALPWQDYSHVLVAAGTGCTFAGLRLGLPASVQLLGVSSLKGRWVVPAMAQRLAALGLPSDNWQLASDRHRGGFARLDAELLSFVTEFGDNTGLVLDPVYTGKAMLALDEFIKNGTIPQGSRVLFVHSGGLQGRRGMTTGE